MAIGLKELEEAAGTNTPKAQFCVGETAWQRAIQPHYLDRAFFIPELQKLLKESGRLHIISDGRAPESFPLNTRFYESSGHTPGRIHMILNGRKENLFFCDDLIPGRHWVHLPLTMGYDRYPELLIDEKAKLYEMTDLESWIFFFTHDPEVSVGRIQVGEKGRFTVTAAISLDCYEF